MRIKINILNIYSHEYLIRIVNCRSINNLNRLYTYVENYRTPEYAQILNSVKDSRLIVPLYRGGLMEGDSPVTFGWQWGVETVNGPYNQGDPKFFKFTVHLEWEQRWLENGFTREYLVQESGAKYVFIRNPYPLFANLNGLSINTSNRFGKLLELNQSVSRATKVTPILMDVGNPQAVTEFFNILIPGGYKMVLVNIHDIEPALVSRFAYVMVDDISKISNYPGQNIFLLTDTPNLAVTETQNLIHFNLPYLTYTNRLFYHGRNADDYMWKIYDQSQEAQINPTQQKVIQRTSQLIAQYLDRLDYTSISYRSADNRIDLSTSSGFTLVKDSYFPYWQTGQGNLIPTSQGFMLVYSDYSNIILNYQLPIYYKFAAICSIFCLMIMTIFLLGTFFSFRIRRP